MLENVLRHINNWFVVPGGVHAGAYSIKNGSITLPFLQEDQYFRVKGSVFNDGVYQYPYFGFDDEDFRGEVWSLAVPKAVIDLASEISNWEEKNAEKANGLFQSESFGGYSYQLKSNGGSTGSVTWQKVYADKLNRWRKL